MSTPRDDEPPLSTATTPSSTGADTASEVVSAPVHVAVEPATKSALVVEREWVREDERTEEAVEGAATVPEQAASEPIAEEPHSLPAQAQREEGPVEQDSVDLAQALSGVAIAPTAPPPSHDAAPEAPAPVVDAAEEIEEEWALKTIGWPPLPLPPSENDGRDRMECGGTMQIICQNKNGPCSLLALCNILLLRSQITIPASRSSVTYTYLSSLLADHLLNASPSQSTHASLSSALSILPSTRYGLSLNPKFGTSGFKPSSTTGAGELSLFSLANVELVHGWLVEPTSEEGGGEEYEVLVGTCGDYDTALERVVEGDVITGTEVGEDDEAGILAQVARRGLWTPSQERVVRDAHIIRTFLASTPTQLTYPGLYSLSSSLPSSSLTALFRNSHLSVLYRRPAPCTSPLSAGPTLFTLVTDSSLVEAGSVVWESLIDVDGSGGEFYDGSLRLVRGGTGGDWVGPTSAPRETERVAGTYTSNDEALARQLQYEDDNIAARQTQDRVRREDQSRPRAQDDRYRDGPPPPPSSVRPDTRAGREGESRGRKTGKKDKCIVM